jgi:hypothetical protein
MSSSSFDCSGESQSFHAAKECPACFFCDGEIVDVSTITYTTRGKPVCKACRDEMDQVFWAKHEEECRRDAALMRFNPESRSSDLIRYPSRPPHAA